MGLADTELGLWAVGRPVGRREGRLVGGQQLEETGGCGRRMLGLLADRADGDDRRKGPTAMTDGGDRQATTNDKPTGVTG